MYDTSTVKLILGSAALLSSTRTNSSEHVKGIIPLSGPSSGALQKSDTRVIRLIIRTAHHTTHEQQGFRKTPHKNMFKHTYMISQILDEVRQSRLTYRIVTDTYRSGHLPRMSRHQCHSRRGQSKKHSQAKIQALNPAKPWSNNSFPKSSYKVCCEQYPGSSRGPADQ